MLDDPLIKVENLRVTFDTSDGPVIGVEDVSFDIKPGETVCIVGESGSGKSVSSLALMRLVEFGGGTITGGHMALKREDGVLSLEAQDNRHMRSVRGNDIAMIFQEPISALNPVFSIERQMTEGLRVHRGMSKTAARARALELMKQVRIPEPERRLKQYPHELSGGMRQRVMIAMALACEPKLLIADEPTTALDVTIQAEILALINQLKKEHGTAVLFITHDMAVVAQVADRVVVMYRGNKLEEGPVQQIFENPQHEYTKALLASVPRLGSMQGLSAPAPFQIPGEAPVQAPPPLDQAGDALLEVKNLTTRFPVKGGFFRRHIANVHAVEDLSFSVTVGETLSLVGESGCGKSTAGRSIMRLVEPQSGSIILGGKDVMAMDQRQLHDARRDIQMVFQDPFSSLNPRMRLVDQVTEPMKNYDIARGSELDDRAAQLFDKVELPRSFMRRYPHELSGGQRQRVAIARALALNPKLIVADEAVSALDVSIQAQVLNLMLGLQAELGISFLFISHDMAVVERVSHRTAVMYLGRIVEIGPRAAIFEDPRHTYTKALLSAVPVADPRQRKIDGDLNFTPIPSPVFPLDYTPAPSEYDEVTPGHFVLRS